MHTLSNNYHTESVTIQYEHANFHNCHNLREIKTDKKRTNTYYNITIDRCPYLSALFLSDNCTSVSIRTNGCPKLKAIKIPESCERFSINTDHDITFEIPDGNKNFVWLDGVLWQKADSSYRVEYISSKSSGRYIRFPNGCMKDNYSSNKLTIYSLSRKRQELLNDSLAKPYRFITDTLGNVTLEMFDYADVDLSDSVSLENKSLKVANSWFLKSIILPRKVRLEESAFADCDSLSKISIGDSCEIHNFAFCNCPNLGTAVLPNSTFFRDTILYGGEYLYSFTLNQTFYGCDSINFVITGEDSKFKIINGCLFYDGKFIHSDVDYHTDAVYRLNHQCDTGTYSDRYCSKGGVLYFNRTYYRTTIGSITVEAPINFGSSGITLSNDPRYNRWGSGNYPFVINNNHDIERFKVHFTAMYKHVFFAQLPHNIKHIYLPSLYYAGNICLPNSIKNNITLHVPHGYYSHYINSKACNDYKEIVEDSLIKHYVDVLNLQFLLMLDYWIHYIKYIIIALSAVIIICITIKKIRNKLLIGLSGFLLFAIGAWGIYWTLFQLIPKNNIGEILQVVEAIISIFLSLLLTTWFLTLNKKEFIGIFKSIWFFMKSMFTIRFWKDFFATIKDFFATIKDFFATIKDFFATIKDFFTTIKDYIVNLSRWIKKSLMTICSSIYKVFKIALSFLCRIKKYVIAAIILVALFFGIRKTFLLITEKRNDKQIEATSVSLAEGDYKKAVESLPSTKWLTDEQYDTLYSLTNRLSEKLNLNIPKLSLGIGHRSYYITSMCYSRDGKMLATCSHDGYVKIWDTKTHDNIISYNFEKRIGFTPYKVDFNSNGDKLLVLVNDYSSHARYILFDNLDFENCHIINLPHGFYCGAVFTKNDDIFVWNDDGVSLYDKNDSMVISKNYYNDIVLNDKRDCFATVENDSIWIISTSDFSLQKSYPIQKKKYSVPKITIYDGRIAYSYSDRKHIYLLNNDGIICDSLKITNYSSLYWLGDNIVYSNLGLHLYNMVTKEDKKISSNQQLTISPDSKRIVYSDEGSVTFYDIAHGKIIKEIPSSGIEIARINGKQIAYRFYKSDIIHVQEIDGGLTKSYDSKGYRFCNDNIHIYKNGYKSTHFINVFTGGEFDISSTGTPTFSNGGKSVFMKDWKNISEWDIKTQNCLSTHIIPDNYYEKAISEDGNTVALTKDRHLFFLKLNNDSIDPILSYDEKINGVFLLKNGNLILIDNNKICIYSSEGDIITSRHKTYNKLCFDNNSNYLIGRQQNYIDVLSTENLEVIEEMPCKHKVDFIQANPDGRNFITLNSGILKIYDWGDLEDRIKKLKEKVAEMETDSIQNTN